MKFIHFGCWGNNKMKENVYLRKATNVFNGIYRLLQNDPKIKFLLVVGDNYYPEKITFNTSKKRILTNRDVESLMNLLKKTKKPVKLLLGNHDIQDITVNSKNINSPGKMCESLGIQFKVGKEKDSNIDVFKDVMSLYYKDESTLIIMIDTTLYFNPNTECYSKFDIFNAKSHENLSNSEILNKLQERQEEVIKDLLIKYKNVENVIFAGHHPIIVYEIPYKKNTFKDKFKSSNNLIKLDNFIKILNNSYDSLKGKNLYHLCADSHFYEKSVITIDNNGENKLIINQYVAGTGGGQLYDVRKKNNILHDNVGKINITYDSEPGIKKHGFLLCSFINNEWRFTFKQTGSTNIKLSPNRRVKTRHTRRFNLYKKRLTRKNRK